MNPLLVLELLLIYIVAAFVVAFLGRHRRIGFWGFFFLSLIVTPILSVLFIYFAATAPHRRAAARGRRR